MKRGGVLHGLFAVFTSRPVRVSRLNRIGSVALVL